MESVASPVDSLLVTCNNNTVQVKDAAVEVPAASLTGSIPDDITHWSNKTELNSHPIISNTWTIDKDVSLVTEPINEKADNIAAIPITNGEELEIFAPVPHDSSAQPAVDLPNTDHVAEDMSNWCISPINGIDLPSIQGNIDSMQGLGEGHEPLPSATKLSDNSEHSNYAAETISTHTESHISSQVDFTPNIDLNSQSCNSIRGEVLCNSASETQYNSKELDNFPVNTTETELNDSSQLEKNCVAASEAELVVNNGDLSPLDCSTGALFCLACHETVTSSLEHMHSNHETVEVSSAISSQHTACESLIQVSANCLTNVARWRQHITSLRADLVKDRKAIAVDLDEMFRELEHRLQERKMALFTQLTDCSYHKESYLDDQLERLDNIQHDLSAVEGRVTKVKKDLKDTKFLADNCDRLKVVADEVEQCTAQVNTFRITGNTCLRFDRKGIIDVRKSLNSLASVTTSHVIPSRSTASGDGLKKAHIHKQTFVKVTPRNSQGHAEREKGLELQAHLYNEEVNVECQCIDNGNGTYNILYIAPQAGNYQLSIKLFQQHIKGSPFSIQAVTGARVSFSKSANNYELARVPQHKVKSHSVHVSKFSSPRGSSPGSLRSAESFSSLKILPAAPNSHNSANAVQPPFGDYLAVIGQFGRRKGDFSNPQGVTVDVTGKIYCTDSTNQVIQVFTQTGSYLNCIGTRGRQPGQLLRPIGICCSKDGCLLFTDYENKCISIFKDGVFVRRIGQGKLIGPKGIATTPKGTVIVADNKGNQVLELSITGRLIRKLQTQSSIKASQLAGPHYVAVNDHGDIYVSDFHNHCIKMFDKEGVFQGMFGNHGTGNGQFNAPTGLALDEHGNILVSDWGNSRIQVFDSSGSFLTNVDTSASPLFGPQSICAMQDSRVIVADSGNHCVKIFKYDLA